jgi:LPS-assembly lipoprotein
MLNTNRHRWILMLVLALALGACGFQMRGIENLKFHNLYIQGSKLSISKELRKSLAVNGVTVVSDTEKAELMLELMSESQEKRILSLSGKGLVREFDLYYRVNFRIKDPTDKIWGEMQTIEQRRDLTYDDNDLLAKQFEETRLYDDMRAEATKELLRRLIVQKPKARVASTTE